MKIWSKPSELPRVSGEIYFEADGPRFLSLTRLSCQIKGAPSST